MPRRPRPTSRKAPSHAGKPHNDVQKPTLKPKAVARPQPQITEEESSEEEEEDEEFKEGASGSGFVLEQDEDSEADADAPRVAQWVDDEELDLSASEEDDSEDEGKAEGSTRPVDIKRLQADLSSLPLGTLRKAQQALARAKIYEKAEKSDEEEDGDDEDGSAPEEEPSSLNTQDTYKKREIAKRANKHAPMEMSSKRQVPRKKANIEDNRPVPRDPRFLHTSGTFSSTHFRSQYGFLSDMHLTELRTLRENLKRARKLLATSPRHLREEREAEVEKLERTVKRAESNVNRDKQEKIQESALTKAKEEEKEKRKQGKGEWYMKNADRKEYLTKAKFEALAEAGGRSAVRKAIEKKQKKINQKEKKKRPFAPGEGRRENNKRPSFGGFPEHGARPSKRQRTS